MMGALACLVLGLAWPTGIVLAWLEGRAHNDSSGAG